MPTIKPLSQSMINKIAAGEVIERPANIVKELVENSIDANAKRIEIIIEKNGFDLIKIIDDGCGIDSEQVRLALAPHATSKIAEADDLFKIQTLGFRGEALASIAEVTHLILRSRTADSDIGTEIRSDGGIFSDPVPCALSVGTTLEVRHLFFNVPARRKFMKSGATEFGHIAEVVNRVALAHPEIHFLLRHNNKIIQELPPVTDLLLRIKKLFGPDVGDRLIYVENPRGNIQVSGYVGHPDNSRPNYSLQYLFLNKRFIRDKSLQHALGEAYRGLLPSGRFPVSFVNITVPPDFVDVNVHPMKLEVRFVDSSAVYAGFLGAIRENFLRSDLRSSPRFEKEDTETQSVELVVSPISTEALPQWNESNQERRGNPPAPSIPDDRDPRYALDETASEAIRDRILQWTQTDLIQAEKGNTCRGNVCHAEIGHLMGNSSTPEFVPYPSGSSSRLNLHRISTGTSSASTTAPKTGPSPQTFQQVFENSQNEEHNTSPNTSPFERQTLGIGRKILQVHQRYLVMETEKGMLIIDQHAIHERILYEKIKTSMNAGRVESQRLLVPVPIDLSPVEVAAVLENREMFAELGLIVEPFGGNTVLISGYPALVRLVNPADILLLLIPSLIENGKKPLRGELLNEMIHQMACKAAIKAGECISDELMTELVTQAEEELHSHHCPHGRPSTLMFSCDELDKMFKRT